MSPYIPLLMLFAFAALVGGGLLLLSHLLGRGVSSPAKGDPYECGIGSETGGARHRVSVKFYLVAMLFILFDVEVVFLYPWAVLFKEFLRSGAGWLVFTEMAVFLTILTIGLVYVYGQRALDWK